MQPRASDAQLAPFRRRMRIIYVLAGALLLGLFALPWNGMHLWDLLPMLTGMDFARMLLLAVGGALLFSAGVLPVPPVFRGLIGLLVGCVGFGLGGVLIDLVPRMVLLSVVTLLASSLLLRAQLPWARLPWGVGLASSLLLWSLYLVPWPDVAPLRVAAALLSYRHDDMAQFIGTYLVLPLPLILLGAVALIGNDVAATGELISWLLYCWGPGALLIMAIDRTQIYMAAATLVHLSCASYGLAEVLRGLFLREDS